MTQSVRRIDFAAGRERVMQRAVYQERAREVADALFAAERSLESSALDVYKLQTALIEARRLSGLSTVVGQDMVRKAAEANSKVGEALSAIVDFHTSAQLQAEHLGVRMDFGSGDKGNSNISFPGA